MCSPGDLPKQVKLKKPSRLKTLDTKPGVCPLGCSPSSAAGGVLRELCCPGLEVGAGGAGLQGASWTGLLCSPARPLHRVLGPPPPGQGAAQTSAQGTGRGRPGEGWGGEPALGEGVHVASSARAPCLGAAEEEAMGHTDSTAETAPAGAHAELHHPPGEARGRAGGGTRSWPQAHSQPPLPRSTTWPVSCPCRRASHPGRSGSRWPSGGGLGGRRSSSVWEAPGL